MSNLEVVKPVVVDGIEFYVSASGKETGVSVSGLTRLCGLESVNTMRTLLKSLDGHSGYTSKQPPQQLEALRGKVFSRLLKGEQEGSKDVEVVYSGAAAEIIAYYAYESRSANKTAKFSLKKFTQIGIDTWIKQVVGYAESASDDKLLGLMQELMSEVRELRSDVKELRDFKKATVELPGLQAQFEGYAKQENILDSAPFALDDWLKGKGLTLDIGKKCSLGRMVADIYKINRQELPKKKKAYELGRKGRGWVTVYTAADTPMLETALQKLLKA